MIDDDTVSRRHALLEAAGGQLFITDLASANGTRIDGKRLGSERGPLRPNQQLRLGDAVIERIRNG